MGTSSSYGGNTKGNPLLPPWAQGDDNVDQSEPVEGSDGDPQVEPEVGQSQDDPSMRSEVIGNQSGARRQVGLFISQRNQGTIRRAAKNYVSKHGGPRGISKSAVGGRAAAAAWGGFLSGIRREGFESTARRLGIDDFTGLNALEALAKIADLLAPVGSTNEEAVARHALLETIGQAYEQLDLEENGIGRLESLDLREVQSLFQNYIGNYIFDRWMQEYGEYMEGKTNSAEELIEVEDSICSFIHAAVQLDFDDQFFENDFNSVQAHALMERIFQDAYSFN